MDSRKGFLPGAVCLDAAENLVATSFQGWGRGKDQEEIGSFPRRRCRISGGGRRQPGKLARWAGRTFWASPHPFASWSQGFKSPSAFSLAPSSHLPLPPCVGSTFMPMLSGSVTEGGKSGESSPKRENPCGHTSQTQALLLRGALAWDKLGHLPSHNSRTSGPWNSTTARLVSADHMGQRREGQGTSTGCGIVSLGDMLFHLSMMKAGLWVLLSSAQASSSLSPASQSPLGPSSYLWSV